MVASLKLLHWRWPKICLLARQLISLERGIDMTLSTLVAIKQASHRGCVEQSERRGVNRARSSVQGPSRSIAKVMNQVVELIDSAEVRRKLEIENAELRDAVVKLALDLQALQLGSRI